MISDNLAYLVFLLLLLRLLLFGCIHNQGCGNRLSKTDFFSHRLLNACAPFAIQRFINSNKR